MKNIHSRKRKRFTSPFPQIEVCSIGTQTNNVPYSLMTDTLTTSATSPIKFIDHLESPTTPHEDVNMSSDSIIILPSSPCRIIINKSNDDQTLKMARDYFGGKPYAGQQKLLADKYPTASELKTLAAQDPKKAANFIFNYNKKENPKYPEKNKLIKFFEDAWNKRDPPNGGAKINEIHLDNSTTLLPISEDDKIKYLGVNILPGGQIEQVTLSEFKNMIGKIDGTKLDGRTKFRIMEKYGLPQLLFKMEHSDQRRAELRKINGCYRNFVRKVHSLRHDFTTSGLHLKPCNGGIGATDIEERVARGKYNATTKMINDNSSKSFAKVVVKSKIAKIRKDNAKYLAIGDDDSDLKSQHQEKLLNRLSKTARVNTSAKSFYQNKRANRWINNDRIPNKLKNDFFKLRYNIMPTRSSTRFFNGGKTKCRGCGGPSENVKHLISKCAANKGLITLRHNSLIENLIKIGPRNQEVRILKEKTFQTSEGVIKPDLITISNNIAKVFEVAVPFEEDEKTLEKMYANKLKKYKEHSDIIRESLQVDKVIFEPIIFGALGDVHEKSANTIVRNFKTTKFTISDLSTLMLRKSRNMVYNITHMR
ncbi:hypothetical protein SNEBB_011279 [Seison nebaliae]|nr:hypothetical protein SNEBB_011279 [Seison nebaliae]